jgi:hypothetical protein
MTASNFIHIEVERILRETEKAFLMLVDDTEIWVPKSCIADAESYEVGDADLTVSIAQWWAEKNDIEGAIG